jgi:murein DD-endopeptidase MepM/ murein hydrolase activator NlpD
LRWFRVWPVIACVGAGLTAGLGACEPPATPAPNASPHPSDEAALEAAPPTTPPEPPPATAFADENLEIAAPEPRVGWPTESAHLTSYFGWRVDPVSGRGTRLHRGIDLRGRPGDLVMSIAPGEIAFAGQDLLLGNMVIVDHGLGVRSFYGHLTDVLVHEGLRVERGTAIGLVGNTGRSAAPHLHLAIQVDGVAIDPLVLIGQPLHAPAALARSLDQDEPSPQPSPSAGADESD